MIGPGVAWITGWATVLLAAAAAAAGVAAALRINPRLRPLVIAAVLLTVILIPIGRTNPAAFLFGALGPLSLASVLAAALILARLLGAPPVCRGRDLLLAAALVTLLGLLLYPAGAGLLAFDPYRFGFHGLVLPLILIALAALALALRSILVPAWIALAILAWLVRLTGSANLWDYLVDPLAWLAAMLFLITAGGIALFRRRAPSVVQSDA
jgi:hypothetical protein